MDTSPLTAAIARGDEYPFLVLLGEVPDAELSGPTGTLLLEAVARAGWTRAAWELVGNRGVDASLPWADGVDPVDWAARQGLAELLGCLLEGRGDRAALGSPHRRALRTAEAAIAADPGAPVSWRGVVTAVEHALGVHREPEVLMARALVHAAPGSGDWEESLFALALRSDRALFDWACARVSDARSVEQRRFALDALRHLHPGLNVLADDDAPGFSADAVAFLRPLLDTEDDPYALRVLLHALDAHGWDDCRTALRYTGHPDPEVRRAAAGTPLRAVAQHGGGAGPDVLAFVLARAADPRPEARIAVADALYRARHRAGLDTPEVRAVLTGLLDDSDTLVRVKAAGALALYGDPRGRAVFEGIRRGFTGRHGYGAWQAQEIAHLVGTCAEAPAPRG
ncbi:HEAT repeat domain-containing protein [Kitasatospora phosalacinea]|uniref:HEAT repeat domain-containing protein n=1 Tax=Kitasatospora phosalacinea TaxID=2065 RepID=UPI000525688C|nr:HEAT repeat domain-containing protein [Kitasatospora phosalacinea]